MKNRYNIFDTPVPHTCSMLPAGATIAQQGLLMRIDNSQTTHTSLFGLRIVRRSRMMIVINSHVFALSVDLCGDRPIIGMVYQIGPLVLSTRTIDHLLFTNIFTVCLPPERTASAHKVHSFIHSFWCVLL